MAMGQHLFWGSPLRRPSLRTIPLGPRGSAIGLGGPFMGQAQNLESLPISAIKNRILATPPLEKLAAALRTRGYRWSANTFEGIPVSLTLPDLSEPEKALIMALAIDPSDETLSDLEVIDGFFGPGYGEQPSLTTQLCALMNGAPRVGWRGAMSQAQAIYAWLTMTTASRWTSVPTNATKEEVEAIRSNPFFCGSVEQFPEVVYGMAKTDFAGWFDIDPSGTWGAVKQQVKNAITVMQVVAAYPFPPPLDLEDKAAFWILSIGEIREIVRTPAPVDPEAVRYWITMTILANYSDWVDRMEQDAKKKAKKAKRKMIMKVIGLTVASIIAAFLLPAVIAVAASAIKTAVTTYVDAQKRRKAAQEMSEAAKMFADDAPAFAREVDHAAQLLDEKAAAEAAALAPPPDVQAAIQEVKAETGPAWGTILPVTGIAAAGLAALAIFK